MNTMFCKRLRMLRKELAKTQQDMAKILRVNRSTYGAYETGKIMPPADKLKVLSDIFHVSLDYLLGKSNVREKDDTVADVTDVSDAIQRLLRQIENDTQNVAFEGEIMSEEMREILATSLENSLKMARLIGKGRK